jgi:hypothetical protein
METNRGVPRCHWIAALAVGFLACAASLPPPTNEWAAAQADVGRAQAGGAPNVPEAKLHLQLAQEDLTVSKRLFDQDNRRAATLITLARTEAQLALAIANDARAEDDANSAEAALAKAAGK